jgi:hypothetical protein
VLAQFRDITILPSLGGIEIKTEMGADVRI